MKYIIILLVAILSVSCNQGSPILGKSEYRVIDTTYVSRNGLGQILGYDVIIEIDSSYYAGELNSDKDLVRVTLRKLKFKK
jgi:hypothetical protein